MGTIRVTMKNGEIKIFEHSVGDRQQIAIKYETGFVVVTDKYGCKTSIPSEDIKEINQDSRL